jgi:hypothetical protein
MNIKSSKHVWVWMQENSVHKAVYSVCEQLLIVYNEREEIILTRKGVTLEQFLRLEALFMSMGAKCLDGHEAPFTYL